MARLVGSLVFSLFLCAACWAQPSSGTSQASAKDNSSQASAKDIAQPVAAEAAPDGKASEGKEGVTQSRIRLTAVESVVSKTEMATAFSELSCDADGNIYLGPIDGTGIRKINAKGELVTTFKPEANPDIEVYGTRRYMVAPDGEVYVPAGSRATRDWRLLVFKSDGSYSSNIRLETGFSVAPATLAIFPDGNLLITGNKLDRNSKLFIVPFTGIYRPDGKLLKEITLEQEEHLPDTSAMRNLRPGEPVPVISNRAVEWGYTEPAKDGNIYIMRWQSPASFYAISPGGEVVKRLTVDPGSSAYDPYNMHISGNRIAVEFRNSSFDEIIKIVDLDGQELETYEISPTDTPKEDLGVFACYSMNPERFTFLISNTDYKLKINHVEAR